MTREVVKTQVFQFGHNLPTMTMEEYADREQAAAIERTQRQEEYAIDVVLLPRLLTYSLRMP